MHLVQLLGLFLCMLGLCRQPHGSALLTGVKASHCMVGISLSPQQLSQTTALLRLLKYCDIHNTTTLCLTSTALTVPARKWPSG